MQLTRIALVILVMVPVVVLVLTRSVVLRPILMPRIEMATGLHWECDSISYWPGSGLTLKNGSASADGFEKPVFEFKSLKVNSPGFAVFRKEILVSRLEIESGIVRQVILRDGSSNLDKWLTSPSFRQPVQNDIGDWEIDNIDLVDCSVSVSRETGKDLWVSKEASRIQMSLNDWSKNGSGSASLEFSYATGLTDADGSGQASASTTFKSLVNFKTNGKGHLESGDIKIGSDPISASGLLEHLQSTSWSAEGRFSDNRVSPLQITASGNGGVIFQLTSFGSLDPGQKEINQNIEYSGNPGVFSLFLPTPSYQLTRGNIQGKGNLLINQFGNTIVINHKGSFNGVTPQISGQQSAEAIDGSLNFSVTQDKIQQSFRVDQLNFTSKGDKGSQFTLKNSKTSNFAYGERRQGFSSSAFEVVFALDLNNWRGFLPDYISDGLAAGSLTVSVLDDGRRLEWDGKAEVENLALASQNPSNPVTEIYNATITTAGPFLEYSKVDKGYLDLELRQSARLAHARMDFLTQGWQETGRSTNLEVTIDDLNHFQKMVQVPYMDMAGGTANVTLSYNIVDELTRNLNSNLLIQRYKGSILGKTFSDTRIDGKFRSDFTNDSMKIPSARLEIFMGTSSVFSITGSLSQEGATGISRGNAEVFYMREPFLDAVKPNWLKSLELSDFNLTASSSFSSTPEQKGWLIDSRITLNSLRPSGFNSSIASALYFLATPSVRLEPGIKKAVIESMKINLTEGVEGNFLEITKPIDIDLGPSRDPVSISLNAPSLYGDSWIELFDFWERNRRPETPVSVFPAPLVIHLTSNELRQMGNDGKTVITPNWKRTAELKSGDDIPKKLSQLMPPPVQ